MRIGLQVERGPGALRHQGGEAPGRRPLGRRGGARHDLDTADPRRVRRHDGGHADRRGHVADRGGDVRRADPAPSPDRAGAAGALEPGGLRGPLHPRSRRLAPLDHRGHARPPLRAPGHHDALLPRRAGPGARRARAWSRWRTSCSRSDNPLDITDITPTPVLIAALGPVMLKLAGERADGTVLWLADERTIASHVVPQITKAADGRRSPGAPDHGRRAGVPLSWTTRSTRRSSARTER